MTPERKTELRAHAAEFEFMRRNVTLELLDALDKAEKERDALKAQVVRLQTGQEIESDYIDELAIATQCVADLMRENDELEARLAESERTLQKRVAELEMRLMTRKFLDQRVIDLAGQRNRYLAALKAEACFAEQREATDLGQLKDECSSDRDVGGITFRVSRKPDGSLEAEEV